MEQIQYSFKRYEKKFLLTKEGYARLLPRLRGELAEDEHKQYTICNLYYDTPTFDLIRASLQKPPYKEKFRLRSYGVPGEDGRVFGEIKKKFKGVVYKRRVTGTPGEMEIFLAGGSIPHEDPQIQRELHWFLQTHPISPRVFLAYDRTAFAGREDRSLRVTFDRDIRWRREELDLRAGDFGEPVLGEGLIVMEVKLSGTIPLWLARTLSEEGICSTSFSKYGTCYQRHLAARSFPSRFPVISERDLVAERIALSC